MAVADLGEEGPAGGPGRLPWTLAGGDPTRYRRRPSWRPPGAGDEAALGIVDRVAERMALAVAATGCSTPSWWSSPGAVADDGDLFLD